MVVQKIEQFYLDDGPESGKEILNSFASKYEALFAEDVDVIGQ